MSRRRQLVDMRAAEVKRKQSAPAVVHQSIDEVVEFITKQIDDVADNLDALLNVRKPLLMKSFG